MPGQPVMSRGSRRYRPPLLAAVLAILHAPAAAAEGVLADALNDVLQAPVNIAFTPNLWGIGVSTRGVIGGAPLAANVSLGRILSHLDGLALGQVEVSKGPAFLLADVTYAHITLPGPAMAPAGTTIPVGTTFATFAAGWAFGPGEVGRLGGAPVTIRVAPFVGAAFTDLSVAVDTPNGTLAKLNPSWWAPVAGARIDVARNRSSIRLEGYTSFASPGRMGHEFLASYAHSFTSDWLGNFTAGVGYRYLFEKRTKSEMDYLQLRLQGPVFYVTFHL